MDVSLSACWLLPPRPPFAQLLLCGECNALAVHASGVVPEVSGESTRYGRDTIQDACSYATVPRWSACAPALEGGKCYAMLSGCNPAVCGKQEHGHPPLIRPGCAPMTDYCTRDYARKLTFVWHVVLQSGMCSPFQTFGFTRGENCAVCCIDSLLIASAERGRSPIQSRHREQQPWPMRTSHATAVDSPRCLAGQSCISAAHPCPVV